VSYDLSKLDEFAADAERQWLGRRVAYTGGMNFALPGETGWKPECISPDGLRGEGVITDVIAHPEVTGDGYGVILNIACDTHGPVTVSADDCTPVVAAG
jgi:hypothetical protein